VIAWAPSHRNFSSSTFRARRINRRRGWSFPRQLDRRVNCLISANQLGGKNDGRMERRVQEMKELNAFAWTISVSILSLLDTSISISERISKQLRVLTGLSLAHHLCLYTFTYHYIHTDIVYICIFLNVSLDKCCTWRVKSYRLRGTMPSLFSFWRMVSGYSGGAMRVRRYAPHK